MSPLNVTGSFYRLENLDSLKELSLDSINGELIYIEIFHDTISGMAFPAIIYNTYDEWTDEYQFRIIADSDNTYSHTEYEGRILNSDRTLTSNLSFFKRDLYNLFSKTYLDSTRTIYLQIKNDSIYIDNSLFIRDKNLRIFQRFTGY